MSQILIDRDLLQRILDAYFDAETDRRAHFGIAHRGQLLHPENGRRYFDAHALELEKERSESQYQQNSLHDQLQTQDDAAFLAELEATFPQKRHRARKSQTTSPPSS